MKKLLYLAALCATMIGVPTQAHASTKTRVAKLEKRVKSLEKQNRALIHVIQSIDARLGTAADSAAYSEFVIDECVLLAPVGAGSLLASATNASFVEGDASLGLPDIFNWLPVAQTAIVAGGPDILMLMDPACVTPARSAATTQNSLHPTKRKLRLP